MFRACLIFEDKEFNENIKDEKRSWTQGKLGFKYFYRDLMDIGYLTYNNLVSNQSWAVGKLSKVKDEDKNYITLVTQLIQKMSGINQG